MSYKPVRLDLTPIQARIVFNVLDGQVDAGACEGGNTPQERRALGEVMDKLLKNHAQWKHVRLDPS